MRQIFSLTNSRHKSSGDGQKQEAFRQMVTMQPSVQQLPELEGANQTIASLKDEVRRLNEKIQSLEQGQDFRSHYAVAGTPHDKIQQRLNRIRDEIQAWTRSLLKDIKLKQVAKKSITDFLIPELQLSEFGEALKSICPGDTRLEELGDVKFQDAIAAIASNLVVEKAVMDRLGPCTREIQDAANSTIYKIMSSSDAPPEHRRAVKMWQASCMKLYNSSIEASDRLGTAEDKVKAINQHIDTVMSCVLAAIKPALDHCQISLGNNEKCQRKLQNTIHTAIGIGRDLSELYSGLVLMNKAWLDRHHTDNDGFISLDTLGSRIEPKVMLSEGVRVVKGKVSLVLFPGLLKYGSDDGENWDSWTVWIPTKVQLTGMVIEGRESADQVSGLPACAANKGDKEGVHNFQPAVSLVGNGIVPGAMTNGETTQLQAAVLNTGEEIHDDMNTLEQDMDMAYGDTSSLSYLSDDCTVVDMDSTGENNPFRQVMQGGSTRYGARQLRLTSSAALVRNLLDGMPGGSEDHLDY